MQILEAPSSIQNEYAHEARPYHGNAAELLVVDTFDELVLLNGALGDYILERRLSGTTDDQRLEVAEELKNQIVDDVIELRDDTSDIALPLSYVIEEKELISDALMVVKARDKVIFADPEPDPDYDWLSNPDTTHQAALTGRNYGAQAHAKLYRDL